MDLQELYAARDNAIFEMDIDTLADISGTAKARAESLGTGSEELGAYQALALGCDADIERFSEGN